MAQIERELHVHHASLKEAIVQTTGATHPPAMSSSRMGSIASATENTSEAAFAKVNSVVAGSPADDAGLRAGDEIFRFGDVDWLNHEKLSKVATTVQANEGVSQGSISMLC